MSERCLDPAFVEAIRAGTDEALAALAGRPHAGPAAWCRGCDAA